MRGIPHHLLDVASPRKYFTVAEYRKEVLKVIKKIFKKRKIPILCGGTWFYIQAVVDGIIIPKVPPDWKLREKLEKKSKRELYQILKKLDPQRAKTIEKENKRRLIRAIEIAKKLGKVPPFKKEPLPYPVLMIGIKKPFVKLKKKIEKRFFNWLKRGLIKEVKSLRKKRVPFKRIEDFGMHYRVISQYLQGKIEKEEMIKKSIKEIEKYAKRQVRWFKKDKRIKWVKNYREAEKLVRNFIKKEGQNPFPESRVIIFSSGRKEKKEKKKEILSLLSFGRLYFILFLF
jgi:tRNA dimethylallyltransferase